MNGLTGLLSATNLHLVRNATQMRFRDASKFKTPEALIVHEQRMLDDDKLLEVCAAEYGCTLETPTPQYVPKELSEALREWDCVPIRCDTYESKLYVGVLPELQRSIPDVRHFSVVRVLVPIYYYVKLYARYFGHVDFLCELPVADKFEMIVEEAIALGASDITLTNVMEGASVYYNVRKRRVPSKRTLLREDIGLIAELLAVRATEPLDPLDRMPKYFGVRLDMHHRGRVVVNRTYYGSMCTIRVLPDDVLTTSLEQLNLRPSTCAFVRNIMLSPEKGLRLFIGETHSGKNTTVLSALSGLAASSKYKIVSVESPVEILVEGVEQLEVTTEEEFGAVIASLLRQNPDYVYITEITDYTAKSTMQVANTGKVVFSSVHANSVSDVISRLMDITGMSSDRIILALHSCCYQELMRDEETDTLYPVNRCVYFSDELKAKLYGKSLGECKMILQEVEAKWV